MARSGTTLVSHIFGSLLNVHIEVEPHALWKSGNFNFLNDEDFTINDEIVGYIRNKFLRNLNGKILVEKSPINSLRPKLVHTVFPNAKIIYIERNPVRCIYSNYVRSVNNDSFKPSIIFKKYFLYTGSSDLGGAISNRGLLQQIRFKDVPSFCLYTFKMISLRFLKMLPFGPKIRDFSKIARKNGLLHYHVQVFKKSQEYKLEYKNLYGNNMEVFKMENIMESEFEIERMLQFAGFNMESQWLNNIKMTFDKERVKFSSMVSEIDQEIERILNLEI